MVKGIIRRIDDLGRVVIPKEMRRVINLKEGDPVEICLEKDMVTVKKYQDANCCSLCSSESHLIQVDGVTICLVCAHKVIKAVQDGEGV